MKEQYEVVLELTEQLIDLIEPAAIVAAIEKASRCLFGESARLVLDMRIEAPHPHLALRSPAGALLGYVSADSLAGEEPVLRSFTKVTGWALSRALPSYGPVWSDWLRMARLVVEEGLPKGDLISGGWKICGALRPAFHVGGDCFSYLTDDDIACFLLLDAVGHGVGSALLAASCRSLWRGVVYEKNLALAVKRLNQRLFDETGSERFVAATMGYCYADGTVEFVCCGQSPVFHLRPPEVEILAECDPPLGSFHDWSFHIQRIKMSPGTGLMLITDGVLDWSDGSNRTFGEIRALQSLRQPLQTPEGAVEILLQALTEFAGGSPPPDDVCCLCIWRNLDST